MLTNIITAVVPSSVLPAHPEGRIFEATVDGIHMVLPDINIVALMDGIRAEQEHRRADYETFKRNIRPQSYLTIKEYNEFHHQAWNVRDALRKLVDTPLIFLVEHDWAMLPLQPIPFEAMSEVLLSGQANFIRLHQDTLIQECHMHLMGEHKVINDVPLRETKAFWAQPHLVRRDWYLDMLTRCFTEDCRTFIEDYAYGWLLERPFSETKMFFYEPEGNMKRCTHLNGRQGVEKYDDRLIR